jgi:hypothetical protein
MLQFRRNNDSNGSSSGSLEQLVASTVGYSSEDEFLMCSLEAAEFDHDFSYCLSRLDTLIDISSMASGAVATSGFTTEEYGGFLSTIDGLNVGFEGSPIIDYVSGKELCSLEDYSEGSRLGYTTEGLDVVKTAFTDFWAWLVKLWDAGIAKFKEIWQRMTGFMMNIKHNLENLKKKIKDIKGGTWTQKEDIFNVPASKLDWLVIKEHFNTPELDFNMIHKGVTDINAAKATKEKVLEKADANIVSLKKHGEDVEVNLNKNLIQTNTKGHAYLMAEGLANSADDLTKALLGENPTDKIFTLLQDKKLFGRQGLQNTYTLKEVTIKIGADDADIRKVMIIQSIALDVVNVDTDNVKYASDKVKWFTKDDIVTLCEAAITCWSLVDSLNKAEKGMNEKFKKLQDTFKKVGELIDEKLKGSKVPVDPTAISLIKDIFKNGTVVQNQGSRALTITASNYGHGLSAAYAVASAAYSNLKHTKD